MNLLTATPVPTLPVELVNQSTDNTALVIGLAGIAGTLIASFIPVFINSWNDKRRWLRQERIVTYTRLALTMRTFISRLADVDFRKSEGMDPDLACKPSLKAFNELIHAATACSVNGSEGVRTLAKALTDSADKAISSIYDDPQTFHLEHVRGIELAIGDVMRKDLSMKTITERKQRKAAARAFAMHADALNAKGDKILEDS